MRLLHLADLHLGKTVNGFSMVEDQAYILGQALDLVKEEGVDAVLIAGDVYDRAVPPEEAVSLFDDFLSRLQEMGKKVFVIAGNHDSGERLGFGSRILKKDGIYIVGAYEGKLPQVTLEDELGPVHFYLMPYITASRVRAAFPDEDIHGLEAAVKTVLSHTRVMASERNVILSHQFVTGSLPVALSGSETAVHSVGTVDEISYHLYDPFDYAALGHIHRRQEAGRKEVLYAGSPLKYSRSEADGKKYFTLVDLKEKGKIEIRAIETVPRHDMMILKGSLFDLIRPENVDRPQDYLFADLTDPAPIPDAMELLRSSYPNAMQLRYVALEGGEGEGEKVPSHPEDESFDDLVKAFFLSAAGREPDEEEISLLREAAEKAGISR